MPEPLFPYDAWIMTQKGTVTCPAVIVKLALVAPAGTVTPPDGVTTSPSILPFTQTDAPPAGAGAVSVTVPVVVCPPSTLGAATVTVARLGAGAGAPTGSSVSHVSGAR